MTQGIKWVLFVSLSALAIGLYFRDAKPAPDELLPQLETPPLQKKTKKQPFDVTVNDITYHIKPLYEYELYGLVVSKHEADSFADYAHKQWGDHLNTADLCVIWSTNAFSGVYERLKFSSGQWTCYVESASSEDWARFSMAQLSNNHMLSDRRDINRMLRKVRIGDQIHFTGYLVEYSHDNFSRGTSTVRTDSGNGACETIYVESLSILQSGPVIWLVLRRLALAGIVLCVVAWFVMPDKYHALR